MIITKYVVLLTGLLIPTILGQNFETGDNSTVNGCSTHCSYHDKDISCWARNLDFFERILLGQMRHYVAVQINIDQFNRRHQGDTYKPNFKSMREESIKRICKHCLNLFIWYSIFSFFHLRGRYCYHGYCPGDYHRIVPTSGKQITRHHQLDAALQVNKAQRF